MTNFQLLLLVLIAFAFGACDSAEGDICGGTALFRIASAVDRTSGVALHRVRIIDASYSPNLLNPTLDAQDGVRVLAPLLENARFEDGVLMCDVPCAFGRNAGWYHVVVASPIDGSRADGGVWFVTQEDITEKCTAGEDAVFEVNLQLSTES